MYTPFLHHFRLPTYLAPILASLSSPFPSASPSPYPPFFHNFFLTSTTTTRPPLLSRRCSIAVAAVFISSRVCGVATRWKMRPREKHKEVGGMRRNERSLSLFLSMNKGVPIRHVRKTRVGGAREDGRACRR